MAALLDTIGECLTKLDQGDFTESLAALDHYEYNSAAFPISTSFTDDNDNDADADADAERLSIASSSFSEVASFRDASSSPIWYDIQPPEAIPEQPLSSQESSSASYSAQDVLQILRRMISRQEALIRTKVTYENHLAQMAVHLQQQSTQIEALGRSASAGGNSSERAAEKKPDQTTKERAPAHIKQLSATPNWWSTFLPGGLSTTTAAAAANSATVPDSDNATATSAMNTDMAAAIASASSMTRNLDTSDNWSPPAIVLPYTVSADPAYMAPPTLSLGDSRFATPNPAYATVPATGELVCIECIQACERVADAVLKGDFSARVRCARCHYGYPEDGEGSEWPMMGRAFAANIGSSEKSDDAHTPLISRPVTHTQRLANRVNRMASLLSFVTREIVDVAHNDGIQGTLGTQGKIDGLRGTWLDLMNEVNMLTTIHTEQVRNIAHVCNSVANGDLTQKVTIDVNGEMLDLKSTINSMVDQLNSFSVEVTRVTHAVGTEGILGVSADVPGVNGVWKQLTDNVNNMAHNLTHQVRDISKVCKSVAKGDLSQTIEVEAQGEMLELKTTINSMVTSLDRMAHEVSRVAVEVGIDGMLGGQAHVWGLEGSWKDLTDNVNQMADNLTRQVRDISQVTKAISAGDLTQKVTFPLSGEMGELKLTINTMVDQLSMFASEITKVAIEVGLEGRLGAQAKVFGVRGVWKDLITNLNKMAYNITRQVRTISEVTASVSEGDLGKLVDIPCMGEMEFLKNTINDMVGRLKTFSSEVSRVAKEVGTDGQLGGQAIVPDVE
ncbi:histidine kinase osmosensor, partial [Coemansia sp. IMI 203386]